MSETKITGRRNTRGGTPRRRRSRRRRGALLAVGAGATAGALVLAWTAVADPATSIAYPAGASATSYSGLAVDTCTAPPVTSVRAWASSPYRAWAVYLGGVNRTCAQPQLTASWVSSVAALGWRLVPVYKGLQPPCGGKPTDQKISPTDAARQGTAAADDAAAKASGLGMQRGSAVYNDIENYATGNAGCRNAVLSYLSAWTRELHRLGLVSGAYVNLASGAPDLVRVYTSTAYARPDALWIARYDNNSSLTGWTGVPNTDWAVHQRGKQYRGTHDETYGGVTLSVDNDRFDAPVATLAYPYTVTSTTTLNARSGPSTSYPVMGTHASRSTVRVVCQAPGSTVGTTSVWDKLTDGSYVTDYYVSTPSNTGYSAPLPRCAYPYQTTAADGLNERTGPGSSFTLVGSLPNGSLAWVTCQKSGSKVGTTAVWDRLTDGRWVSDYYVANPSNTSFSAPAPRC